MLYQAKKDGDEGVLKCKFTGQVTPEGYEETNEYFVDNSGFGTDREPALTLNAFLNKVKAGFFYGIKNAGQFQVYIGEYKKIKSKSKTAQGIISSKLVSKSCRVIKYINNDLTVRLYYTDILKRIGNKLILSSGGFRTTTTKTRINEYLPDGVKLYQQDYDWFINNNGKILEFKDGIEITI